GLGIDGDNNSNLNSKPELPDLDFGPELDLEKGLGIENNNFDTSSRVNFVLNQEILQNDSADEWDGYTDEIKLLEESLENKNRNYYLFDDIASTVDQESESDLYDNELLVVNNSPINENIKDESIDFELKINNNNEKILEGPAGLDLTVKSDRNVQITDDDMKMINEIIDGTVTNSETSNNEEDLFIGQLYENSDETNINDVEKSIKNKDKNVDDDDLGISNLFVNKPNNQKNNEINDLDNDILHLDLLFESEKDSDKSDHDNLDENLELNLLFDDTDKYKKKTFNDNEEDDDNIIDISNLFLLEDKINNKFDEDYSNINESDTKLTDEEVEVINQVIMNTKIDPNYDNKLEESFTDFKISSQISKSAVRQSQNMYNSDTEYHINDDDDDIDISDTFLFDIKDNFFTQNPIDGFKNKEEKFELSEGDFLLLDEIIEETNKQQLELLTPEDNMLLNSNDFIEGSYAKKAVLVNSKSNTNVVNLRGSINTISIENNVRKANIIKRPVNSDIKQVKSPSIEDYSVKLKKVNGENEEKNEHDREREWIFSFAPKLRPGRMEGRRDLFTEEEIQRAKREAANLE
ncbi:hypothetical protein FG386_003050, partial [Cryptosporidium ryanae]|uniref:uncharacterized protein n=1 Tax=Cryptosporidium ryanae TaxID=515981 RepID=UPI00351A7D30